jgi:hypothetical protein
LSEIRAEMEAAFEAASGDSASPAIESTPEVVSTPEAPSASESVAASPPSDTGAAPEPENEGPIPYSRHKAVLTNVRKEYDWVDQHGGAEQARQKLAVTRWLESDPVGFLRTMAANQNIDLRSLLPEQPAPPPKAEEPPQPDILLENGQMTYSNERMRDLLAYERTQLRQQFDSEIAPIKQDYVVNQQMQRSTQTAKQQLAYARQHLPAFSDHEKEIGAVIRSAMERGQNISLDQAYNAVVPAKLAERATQAETQGYQRALTEFQTKAGAAGQLTPRTSGAVAPSRPGSIREALEQAING